MHLSLVLSHGCNLRCTYCYTGEKYDRPMPLPVARRAVDFGFEEARRSPLTLAFFGGEPLLELELLEAVVRYAVEQSRRRNQVLHFAVTTNGTLLDERRLALLREYRFQVQVSVDGGPAAHDLHRRFVSGAPSWEHVAGNLSRLREAGLAPQVLAVLTPENAHLLADSYAQLVALGQERIYFSPSYGAPWDEAAAARLAVGLRALGEAWLGHWREGRVVKLDPLHGKIVSHLLGGSKRPVACGFGEEELAVAPSGRLYPCDRLVREDDDDTVAVGNVFGGVDRGKRAALTRQKLTLDEECAACELRPRCTRACGCAQVETGGALGAVSADFCFLERSFMAEADRVANALFAEKNPAFLERFYARGLESLGVPLPAPGA